MQTTSYTCPHCNNRLPVDPKFCPSCGVSLSSFSYVHTDMTVNLNKTASISAEEKQWAMYLHLTSIVGWFFPLLDLVVALFMWSSKKDSSAFINAQGKEVLNYHINFYFLATIFAILSCISIGMPFLFLLGLADVALMIIASVQANEGKFYRYPVLVRVIK